MFVMSGSIPTVSRGNSNAGKTWLCILFPAALALFPQTIHGQYYYVNTYENPQSDGTAEIYVKSINLDSDSITESVVLANRGFIYSRKPATIMLNGHLYLLTFSQAGMGPAKNSPYGGSATAYSSVLRADDGHLTTVRSDSLHDAMIEDFRQYQGEAGFRLGLRHFPDTTTIFPFGLYDSNNNMSFRLLRRLNSPDEPGLMRQIGSFEYLIKIPYDTNHRLYYNVQNSQWWLAKLDPALTAVSDSLQLRPSGGAATIFAFHPLRNKFYCLHVNFEFHTGEIDSVYKRRQDYYINPDVWIIDPATLEITEEHPIADYPDGNYPRKENGLADVVGDFIVYYFFEEDAYYRYDPAMLFIFDTRTNEATWLRVGWR